MMVKDPTCAVCVEWKLKQMIKLFTGVNFNLSTFYFRINVGLSRLFLLSCAPCWRATHLSPLCTTNSCNSHSESLFPVWIWWNDSLKWSYGKLREVQAEKEERMSGAVLSRWTVKIQVTLLGSTSDAPEESNQKCADLEERPLLDVHQEREGR